MLPSADKYLKDGGFAPDVAAYILIACFLSGVIGIQILSRFLHHYIPSHVVDCDHTHEEPDADESPTTSDEETLHSNSHIHSSEETPLLAQDHIANKSRDLSRPRSATVDTTQRSDTAFITAPSSRRPSLQTRFTARMSTLVTGAKNMCDEGGPCYGYSDPCGQECFKAISRSPTRTSVRRSSTGHSRYGWSRRTSAHPLSRSIKTPDQCVDEESAHHGILSKPGLPLLRGRQDHQDSSSYQPSDRHISLPSEDLERGSRKRGLSASSSPPNDPSAAHHHHVASNAFLSIGLQTSIAIALHKLPEGFITYATNHANSKLGFAVFMALFIHNITEGFAMALPLYLALGSRWKAMFWSSLLGGISQPLGAGVAAFWFKMAGQSDMQPGEKIYGCMFAATAGIMTSVALQLFAESMSLTHNRNICITFAFIGMGILGFSFALTAH
jgi:ZIP family zinc transporter